MAYKIKSKGTKYRIYGQAFNVRTGRDIGKEHSETIDTDEKGIFYQAKNKKEIEKRFENFWNSNPNETEKVLVTKIIKK